MVSLERDNNNNNNKKKKNRILVLYPDDDDNEHPDLFIWKSSQGELLPELYLSDLLLSLEGILTLGIFATEETSITNITV